MARQRISVAVPELFLGLLSLALAAVWIGHIVTSMVLDARHARDTIVITGARSRGSAGRPPWTSAETRSSKNL